MIFRPSGDFGSDTKQPNGIPLRAVIRRILQPVGCDHDQFPNCAPTPSPTSSDVPASALSGWDDPVALVEPPIPVFDPDVPFTKTKQSRPSEPCCVPF